MKGSRALRSVVVLIGATLILDVTLGPPASPSVLDPNLRLTRRVGPPTTTTFAGGRGFGSSETVDLTFDGSMLATATTDPSGAFQTEVVIPAFALPGLHHVQATGESSELTAKATFIVNTDWAVFHYGPARTGYNSYENVLDPSNVSTLRVVWRFPASGGFGASPALAQGVLYVAGFELHALNASSGAEIWSIDLGGFFPTSSPAVAYGMVYVGVGPEVWAIDGGTGERLWKFYAGGSVDAAPAVMNGVVYVPSLLDGHLWALDALTGAVRWDLHTGAYERSIPAVAGGVVYWGSGNGTLYALDAATGAQLWTAPVPIAGLVGPAVVDGVVYVGAADGRILALDATTGATQWSFPTRAGILGSPAVADGVVYVPSGGNNATTGLYALDANTGARVWSRFVFHFRFCSSPVVANGVVYVASPRGGTAALDAASGTVLWRHRAGGVVYSSMAVANGRVYLASSKGATYAFGL